MDKLKEIEKLLRKHPDNKLTDHILAIINPKTVEELVETLSNYHAGKAEESAREAEKSASEAMSILNTMLTNQSLKINTDVWEDALENMWTDPTEKVAPPEKIFTHKVDINGQVYVVPMYPNKELDDEDLT